MKTVPSKIGCRAVCTDAAIRLNDSVGKNELIIGDSDIENSVKLDGDVSAVADAIESASEYGRQGGI